MSLRRYSVVFCDVCGDHSFDNMQEDGRSARRELREQGWKQAANGDDVCPNEACRDIVAARKSKVA